MLDDLSAESLDVFMPNLHDQFREYVQNRRRFNGPDLCLADYALRYSRRCKKRKSLEAEPAEDNPGGDEQGDDGDAPTLTEADVDGIAYPPALTQRPGVQKRLRIRPCIPRFSVLPSPTSVEQECRAMIMLFAPGSAWATHPEAQEEVALLGGCPSYAERYAQLREHIEPLAEQYKYKAAIDWERLMAAREAEMEDDARSAYSENSMDRALMAEGTIPDLPEALPLQDQEEAPTHISSTATTHVLWDNDAYLKQGSILTGQQRRVCQYAVQHVLMHEWGFEKDPLMLVVTGGAGTGKSCTLRFSREALERVLPRNIHGDGAGILIQVAAQNGKAAWLANGQTLHSAMGWVPNSEGNLSNAKKQVLIAKYKDLKVFILDEASQVPNKNLAHLHNDLQEYGNNFRAPFGDVNMACFADFMQLEPIIRGQQFFAPCQLALRGLDSDVQLWELFRVAELTQVMRQEDGWMLHALNRMRIGEHTAEDNARWKGLERDAPAHLPMHCCTNERVVQHNKRVYNASPEQPACFAAQALTPNSKSEALTFFKQEANTVRENYSRAMYKSGGLFLLYLKVGMMVEYTVNNQQGDGLVNGADGILKAVTRTYEPRQTHGVEVYDVAWVLFTDPRVGQVRRRNQKRFLPVGETTFHRPGLDTDSPRTTLSTTGQADS
eukprot:jgi/Botrbrau1/4564/Bobra.60_2s0051.1